MSTPLVTFRRAIRRYRRRACQLGFPDVANILHMASDLAPDDQSILRHLRGAARWRHEQGQNSAAWIYERAAGALERYCAKAME